MVSSAGIAAVEWVIARRKGRKCGHLPFRSVVLSGQTNRVIRVVQSVPALHNQVLLCRESRRGSAMSKRCIGRSTFMLPLFRPRRPTRTPIYATPANRRSPILPRHGFCSRASSSNTSVSTGHRFESDHTDHSPSFLHRSLRRPEECQAEHTGTESEIEDDKEIGKMSGR